MTKGKEGYEIFEEFQPRSFEKIFDKEVNSAFKGTGLLEYLFKKEEKELMIVGLQTEYCIDATIKAGFEHGFKIFIPEETNTTVDNQYMPGEKTYQYYNHFIWNKRYADCIPMEKAINLLQMRSENGKKDK